MSREQRCAEDRRYKAYQVLKLHHEDGHTITDTAKAMNVDRRTVQRIAKTKEYYELAQAALQEVGETPKKIVQKYSHISEKAYKLTKDGDEYPDSGARLHALDQMGEMYGMKPPKEHKLIHSIHGASDEEIDRDLDASIEELRQTTPNHLTGTFVAGAASESQDAEDEPGVVEQSGESGVDETTD